MIQFSPPVIHHPRHTACITTLFVIHRSKALHVLPTVQHSPPTIERISCSLPRTTTIICFRHLTVTPSSTMHIFRWIVILGFTLVFVLHDHIFHGLNPYFSDVKESVNTYLKFHSVKNVAFRYPEDLKPLKPQNETCQLVPKIMHHIWLQEDGDSSIERYNAALDSCVKKHPSEEG